MAVRHIKEYYNKVSDQYLEMVENLKDFQKEAEEGLVSPEQLENIEAMIEPLKNNYMTLSWIMYLLKLPNKEERKKSYNKKNEKFLKTFDMDFSEQGVLDSDNKILDKMKK